MKISKVKDRNLYYCNVRKPDGKYKKVYGKTKKEVREKADSLTSDIREGRFVETNKITVSEWLKEWSDNYLINITELSQMTYKSVVNNHLIPYFGNKKLQNLAHNDIQRMVNEFNSKLSCRTVQNIHLVLHRALGDAVVNGFIKFNPADNIKLPKEQKKPLSVMDITEVFKFIDLCYKLIPDYADCFEFLVHTGLRIGEFTGLTIDSFDRENKRLKIDKQYLGKVKKFGLPKNGVIRFVGLSDRAFEIIEERLEVINKIRKNHPKFNPDNLLFLNPDFKMISQRTLRKKIKIVGREMNKPDLRVHDLRHTFATISLESGTGIRTIQERLGHSDPTFTMNKYAHSTMNMNMLAAENLNKIFNNRHKIDTSN